MAENQDNFTFDKKTDCEQFVCVCVCVCYVLVFIKYITCDSFWESRGF
jgi:hypothetical protein